MIDEIKSWCAKHPAICEVIHACLFGVFALFFCVGALSIAAWVLG